MPKGIYPHQSNKDFTKRPVRLEVHHKIPFILDRDNSLINLITYCPKFHKIEEARIMKELKKQEVEFCQT